MVLSGLHIQLEFMAFLLLYILLLFRLLRSAPWEEESGFSQLWQISRRELPESGMSMALSLSPVTNPISIYYVPKHSMNPSATLSRLSETLTHPT